MRIFGKQFPWGVVTTIHEIGEYSIVEYKSPSENTPQFHPYINKIDTCMSYETLDEALIGVVTYKWGGANSRTASFYCKGIGMYDENIKLTV